MSSQTLLLKILTSNLSSKDTIDIIDLAIEYGAKFDAQVSVYGGGLTVPISRYVVYYKPELLITMMKHGLKLTKEDHFLLSGHLRCIPYLNMAKTIDVRIVIMSGKLCEKSILCNINSCVLREIIRCL